MPDLRTGPKHLTLEERTEIQDCLFHGVTFKAIARRIEKDPTTVSKEVRKHIQVIPARIENAAPCSQLLKAPFVCNGCQRKRYCKLEKHEYLAVQHMRLIGIPWLNAGQVLLLQRNLFTRMTESLMKLSVFSYGIGSALSLVSFRHFFVRSSADWILQISSLINCQRFFFLPAFRCSD